MSVTVMLADGTEYLALIWVVMVLKGTSYSRGGAIHGCIPRRVIGYQKLPFPCLMLLDGISRLFGKFLFLIPVALGHSDSIVECNIR